MPKAEGGLDCKAVVTAQGLAVGYKHEEKIPAGEEDRRPRLGPRSWQVGPGLHVPTQSRELILQLV